MTLQAHTEPSLAAPPSAATRDTVDTHSTWLDRLRFTGKGRAQLVLEASPIGIQAMVVRRSGKRWSLAAQAISTSTDPAEALPALLADLNRQGVKAPRSACVVLAGAALAQVELPADPVKPRPPAQMLEIARYEAEPMVAAHNAVWPLSDVVASHGLLDADIREALLAAEHAGQLDAQGDPLDFGHIALQRGLLTHDVLEEMVSTQHTLLIDERDPACGWIGSLVRDAHGHRLPLWQVAATDRQTRQRWCEAARASRLRLKGFWPRTALAGAHASDAPGVRLVLEIWPEQTVALRLVDGRVGGLRCEPRQGLPVDGHTLADLLLEWQVEPIAELLLLVVDPAVDAQRLDVELQHLLRLNGRVLAGSPQDSLALRAQAVCLEAEADADLARLPRIALTDPRAPWWKDAQLRPWLVGSAVVLALGAWQVMAWVDVHQMRSERAALERKISATQSEQQQSSSLSEESARLDAEATKLRADLQTALARADALTSMSERIETVPALIRVLGAAVDPQIVLDAVREGSGRDARIGIEVRAWSPDPARLQAYAERVQQGVASLGMAVAPGDLSAKKGRLGSPGFQISFWLVPESAELALASSEEAKATAGKTPSKPLAARPGGRR